MYFKLSKLIVLEQLGVYGAAVKLIPKFVLMSFVMSLDDDSLIYGMSVRFKSKT